MRKNLGKKLTAVITAAAMAMCMTACGGDTKPATEGGDTSTTTTDQGTTDTTTTDDGAATTDDGAGTDTATTDDGAAEEDVEPYTVITDADGNPIDLGGVNVIIRDWWSNPDDTFLTNPKNDYDDARKEFVEWAEEKYNFTVTQQQISDWGSTPADYVDYVTSGGDENYYVWIVRDAPEIAQAMSTGLMYDLSKLDFLDFSDPVVTANKVHEQYTYKDGIYAMFMGVAEPRGGFFVNKDIVGEDLMNQIYDAQADGTWDWDMFIDVLDQVQKDTNNDGTNDVWGVTGNTGGWARMFAASNGGEFVGNTSDGYVYKLEDANTVEGIEFMVKLLNDYYMPRPADAQWDYYKEEFKSGTVAFCENGGTYPAYPGGEFSEVDFPMGYVMCPKGTSATGQLTNIWSNNPTVIPSCYDDEKAYACAFAYYILNSAPAGYEDYNGYIEQLKTADVIDERAIDETAVMSCTPEHGMITYDGMIPGLDVGPQLAWNIGPGADVTAAIEAVHESWNTFIDTANGK